MRRLKGLAIGLIAAIALSGTALLANSEARELVFGIAVSLDGVAVQFEEDMRPFVIDGRTFLPVRAIADLAGLGVDFDGATNTVLLTTGEAGEPTSAPMISEAPAGPNTQTRQVTFGVAVSLDGVVIQFTEDMRPFITEGRTFLPVRAIADLAGLEVDFDSVTNTVLLTSSDAPVAAEPALTPKPTAAGEPLVLVTEIVEAESRAIALETSNLAGGGQGYEATIGDRVFRNSLRFDNTSGILGGEGHHITFALNGQYTLLTGYAAAVRVLSGVAEGDIRIYGDGVLLAAFDFDSIGDYDLQEISVDVTNVQSLLIRGRNTEGTRLHTIVASPMIQ